MTKKHRAERQNKIKEPPKAIDNSLYLIQTVTVDFDTPQTLIAKTEAVDGLYFIENVKETVCRTKIRIEPSIGQVRNGRIEVLLYNLKFGDYTVDDSLKIGKLTTLHTPTNYSHT